jgi:hypothetical protein
MNSSKCPSPEADSTSNAGAYSQLVNISFLVLITFEVYIHTITGQAAKRATRQQVGQTEIWILAGAMIFLFSNMFKQALRLTHLNLCLFGTPPTSTTVTN